MRISPLNFPSQRLEGDFGLDKQCGAIKTFLIDLKLEILQAWTQARWHEPTLFNERFLKTGLLISRLVLD